MRIHGLVLVGALFIGLSLTSFGQTAPAEILNFPQMANGDFGGIVLRTVYVLSNHQSVSIRYVTVCSDANGNPLRGRFWVSGGGQVQPDGVTVVLRPNTTSIEFSDTTERASTGWCQIQASAPIITQSIIQSFDRTDSIIGLVGIPPTRSLRRFAVQIFQGNEVGVGLAAAVVSPNAGSIEISVYRSDRAFMGRRTLSIPGWGHFAGFFRELFPSLPYAFDGVAIVNATVPLSITALNLIGGILANSPVSELPTGFGFKTQEREEDSESHAVPNHPGIPVSKDNQPFASEMRLQSR